MGEVERVEETLRDLPTGELIDDTTVRIIASWWHGGQASALYSLTSCGAIDDRTETEIMGEIGGQSDVWEVGALTRLLEYVQAKGERGPQSGWSELRW